MIQTIAAALIAGIIYTFIMGIFFKRNGISPSRKYISGTVFTISIFVIFLILDMY